MKQIRERSGGDNTSPCVSSAAMLAAVDGDADEVTQEFLRTHPHAACEVEMMRQVQGYLRARLYRFFCPSSDLLMEYRLGFLEPDQRAAIAEHLATCPHCARELELFETPVAYG